jgi:hypothetical protein
MTPLADALLEAHVQHVLAAWRGDAAARAIAERVSSLLRWFGEVKLDQVATRAQVMGLIQRHVIELRVSGGITELAGELSRLVFSSQKSAATRLDQVLTDEEYGEFADKVIALEGVRRGVIAMIAQSEAFGLFRTRVIAHTLSALVFRRTAPRGVGGSLLPALEQRLTRVLTRYFERQKSAPLATERELLELVDPELLRSLIDDIWATVAPKPLTESFAFIGEQDLEDFVVLGYEFWLRYRRSDYFREIMEEMVDHFFAKYGGLSLAELLEDMGVDDAMIARELETCLVPLLDEAARTGFLEQQVRARLGAFYGSPAAEALLQTKP